MFNYFEEKNYSFFQKFEEVQNINIKIYIKISYIYKYIKIYICILRYLVLKISVTDLRHYKLFLSFKCILQTHLVMDINKPLLKKH